MTNKLPDIQEEPDILKLKEKLQSISNPYYIAPYDSLQLYHYEVLTDVCMLVTNVGDRINITSPTSFETKTINLFLRGQTQW